MVYKIAWRFACSQDHRSLSRNRKFRSGCATLRYKAFYWIRNRRRISRRSQTADWVAHASRVLAMASSSSWTFRDAPEARACYHYQDCFGETPKPAGETRSLPGSKFLERFDQLPRQWAHAIENALGNWFRRQVTGGEHLQT